MLIRLQMILKLIYAFAVHIWIKLSDLVFSLDSNFINTLRKENIRDRGLKIKILYFGFSIK